MRKITLVTIGIVVCLLLCIFLRLIRKHPQWVQPQLVGTVVYSDNATPVPDARITVDPDYAKTQIVLTDAKGGFSVGPVKGMKRSFPGDTCYTTVVTVEKAGYKSVASPLTICGGELSVEHVLPKRQLSVSLVPTSVESKSMMRVVNATWDAEE